MEFWLEVLIIIDLLMAWWYAKDRNVCKVVIMCTAAICGTMGLCG